MQLPCKPTGTAARYSDPQLFIELDPPVQLSAGQALLIQILDRTCRDPTAWRDAMRLTFTERRSYIWVDAGVPRPPCPEDGELRAW